MNIYIGENIKRLRAERQMTQEQLADAMGISCAAVSKWEREETLPDITHLPVLAHYFNVSIDELMGYDAARVEEEINQYLEERRRLFMAGKKKAYTRLSEKAYRDYPNDYRVMNCYMWDKVGDYADNDPSVILENKEELSFLCRRILDGCSDAFLRMNAVNMQGKILHAEGKTEEAVALYQKEIPDWYLTHEQKTEQLFAKDTPEFARQLRFNMLELGAFAVNKKSKELWFCRGLTTEEKGEAALAVCAALDGLRETAFLCEADYYLSCFALEMAGKMKAAKGDADTIKRLQGIGEEAKKRFLKYGETDETIKAYCQKIWPKQG